MNLNVILPIIRCALEVEGIESTYATEKLEEALLMYTDDDGNLEEHSIRSNISYFVDQLGIYMSEQKKMNVESFIVRHLIIEMAFLNSKF